MTAAPGVLHPRHPGLEERSLAHPGDLDGAVTRVAEQVPHPDVDPVAELLAHPVSAGLVGTGYGREVIDAQRDFDRADEPRLEDRVGVALVAVPEARREGGG